MSKDNQGDLLNEQAFVGKYAEQETIVQEVEEVQDEGIKVEFTTEGIEEIREKANQVKIVNDPPASTKEIAVQSEIGNLIKIAVSSGAPMDTLERLISMKNAEEDRNCKKEFDLHFSEMQKDYIPATKGSDVYNKAGTAILYKFCNLESILKVYAPIIARHGFSFKWKEEMKTDSIKVISCFLSGYGHEEKSSVEIPINAATSFTNSIQQRGVSTSYGKRYSFINLLGVIIADEDNDAVSVTFEDGVQYAREIERIRGCITGDDLKNTMKEIWEEFSNNKEGRDICSIEYNKKKAEFMGNAK